MIRLIPHLILRAIILIQVTFLLSSCNIDFSQIGSNPTSNKRFGVNLQSKEDQSTYEGSQAYNSSLFTGEEVNGQTGSLDIAKSLINVDGIGKDIGLNFKLIYSSTSNQKGILHLPQGWSYQISYIMGNKSLNIDGANYIIDNAWHDSSGYASGLKYINNHAVKFKEVFPEMQLKCANDKRYYHYVYSATNGSHQYFDVTGKLIAKDDSFGSCISYYYSGSGNLYSLFLDHIVDSYGQIYQFSYSPNKISILSAGRTLSSFEYSNSGILLIRDAMDYPTKYNYMKIYNKEILNQIQYPSGLVTTINYVQMPVIKCLGDTSNTLLAVSDLTHGSGNNILNKTSYIYGSSSGGANYTGYSLGHSKYCMDISKDNLIDSNDYSFVYDVLISKNGDSNAPTQKSQVYYNYLHLPIKKVDLNSSGQIQKEVTYTYDIDPNKTIRSASYSQPIKIVNKNLGVVVSTINNKYNEYNLLTNSDSIMFGGISSSKSITYFPEAFYLAQNIIDKDNTNGILIETKNTLSDNRKSISSSALYYNGSGWKMHQFTYDNLGRLINDNISWVGGSHPGVSSSNIAYSYSYANGVLTTVKTDGGGNKHITETSTILSGSKVLKKISPSGKTVSYTYDALGRELTMTSPMGHKVSSVYHVSVIDGTNSIVKTNPLGYTIITNYDSLGRVSKVTDNGKSSGGMRILEVNTYNSIGNLSSKVDKFGNLLKYSYDEFGRIIRETDALNNVKTSLYVDDKLKSQTFINNILVNEKYFNGLGNLIIENIYSTGHSYKKNNFIYSAFGNQIQSSNIINNKKVDVTQYTYDPNGKLIKSVSQKYDGISVTKLISLDLISDHIVTTTSIAGRGAYTSDNHSYNNIGQLVGVINNLKQTKSLSYNSDGQVSSMKEYDGSITSYSYDGDGNQITSSKNGRIINKTYDAIGNLTGVSNGNSSIKYTYTNTGLLTSVQYDDGKNMYYGYNDIGLLTSKTNVFGVNTYYTYDNIGRVQEISMLQTKLDYHYLNNKLINGKYGMLTGISLLNNGNNVITHNYIYDEWGKILNDEVVQGFNTISISYKHDWLDKLSQIKIKSNISEVALNLTKNFSYDSLEHLLTANSNYSNLSIESNTSESYTYDANGNVVTYIKDNIRTDYVYNNINQLTAVNGVKISYDKRGNMLNDADGANYTYNTLNQLVSVSNSKNLVKYSYYADGLLKSKNLLGSDILFYYDRGNFDAIQSVNSKSKISNKDSLLLSNGSPIATYRDNNPTYFLQAANSTIGLIDKDNKLINSYTYSSYGSSKEKSPTDATQSFLWNQEYNDTDTNLVYLRARFYNPKLMRFNSMDTVNVTNLYNFGDGDPINNVDPSGHLSENARWGIGLAGLLIGVGGVIASVATFGASATAAVATDAALATVDTAFATVDAVAVTADTTATVVDTAATVAEVDAEIATATTSAIEVSQITPEITTGTLLRAGVSMTSGAMVNGAYTNSWAGARDGALLGLDFDMLIEGFTYKTGRMAMMKYLKNMSLGSRAVSADIAEAHSIVAEAPSIIVEAEAKQSFSNAVINENLMHMSNIDIDINTINMNIDSIIEQGGSIKEIHSYIDEIMDQGVPMSNLVERAENLDMLKYIFSRI